MYSGDNDEVRNNMYDMLLSRRSIRAYKQDMVPDDVLERIIKAGTYAPSGMNRQAAIIVAVTNKEMRDRLSKMNAEVMGTNGDPFYGAPVILIVLADRNVRTYLYDGSLVMGNLMNAAYAEGIGNCVLGFPAESPVEKPRKNDFVYWIK